LDERRSDVFAPYCALPANTVELRQPPALVQSIASASLSVVLAQRIAVVDKDLERADNAPLQLVPRHQVNLRIGAVRPMEFASVDDDIE
jgi:hypothetical protein